MVLGIGVERYHQHLILVGGNDLTARRLGVVVPELVPAPEAIIAGILIAALSGMRREVDVRDGAELRLAARSVEQHAEPLDRTVLDLDEAADIAPRVAVNP